MASNPRVFLDITISDIQQDRIEIDLYKNDALFLAENFLTLCNKQNPVSFKDSIFHYIIPDLLCMGGNLKNSDGTRFGSIYGDEFPDVDAWTGGQVEFDLVSAHAVPQLLANHTGPYPYVGRSQFCICIKQVPILGANHVVFGNVAKGRNTILNMSNVGSHSGVPTQVVKVVDCGQIW